MDQITIKTPDFLRGKLQTPCGLIECSTLLDKVFHESYQQISDGILDLEFAITAWFHRAVSTIFLEVGTAKGPVDHLKICEKAEIYSVFMTGRDEPEIFFTGVVASVFDTYLDGCYIDLESDEMKTFRGLRNALTEITIRFYTELYNEQNTEEIQQACAVG